MCEALTTPDIQWRLGFSKYWHKNSKSLSHCMLAQSPSLRLDLVPQKMQDLGRLLLQSSDMHTEISVIEISFMGALKTESSTFLDVDPFIQPDQPMQHANINALPLLRRKQKGHTLCISICIFSQALGSSPLPPPSPPTVGVPGATWHKGHSILK